MEPCKHAKTYATPCRCMRTIKKVLTTHTCALIAMHEFVLGVACVFGPKRDEGKVLDESISNSAQNQRSSLLSVGARARSVRISKARSGDSYFMLFYHLQLP